MSSIFKITKSYINPTIKDPNDPNGIRCIVDTETRNSAFIVNVDKVFYFKNPPDTPGIDLIARKRILETLKEQIDKELENLKNEEYGIEY